MPSFGLPEATLLSLFTASALWGIHFATFWLCVQQLLAARRHVKLLVVACAIFVLATLRLAILLERNVHAFIVYEGASPAGDLMDIASWNVVARGSLFLAVVLLGDGMLIYRCFVLYGRSWRIVVLPALLMLGNMVGCVAVPIQEALIHGNAALTSRRVSVWTTVGSVFALGNNFSTTGLIAYRLIFLSRLTTSARGAGVGAYRVRPVNHALRIVIESGVLYTASMTLLFATSLAKHNSVYVVSESISQIVGICFNLIIIRVSQNRTLETEMSRATTATIPIQFVPGTTGVAIRGNTTVAPSAELEINMTKDVDNERDFGRAYGTAGKVE